VTARRLVVLASAVLIAGACAESTATATNSSGGWDGTRTVSPDLVRAAEAVVADAPDADPGWSTGVVLAENADDWGSDWAVMTADSVVVLSLAVNCGDADTVRESDLVLVLDPGDLITWSNDGDDQVVCSDQLDVITKAAA
jgi:hypothetical protein